MLKYFLGPFHTHTYNIYTIDAIITGCVIKSSKHSIHSMTFVFKISANSAMVARNAHVSDGFAGDDGESERERARVV